VRLWDVAGRTERAALKGHKEAIRALAFSSDGAVLATAAEDGTIKLWDAAGGPQRATLAGQRQGGDIAAFDRRRKPYKYGLFSSRSQSVNSNRTDWLNGIGQNRM
jgi:WD40 repeat protein